jgi:hypothetical protein
MVSSSSSTPLPPRAQSRSSATGGSQPLKQPSQNRTSYNHPPSDLPSLSGLSIASGSQPPKTSPSTGKSRARAPQPTSSSTSSIASATPPSTPRQSGKPKGSQQSLSLPSSSIPCPHYTRPSHSQCAADYKSETENEAVTSSKYPVPPALRRDPGIINAVWRESQVNKYWTLSN